MKLLVLLPSGQLQYIIAHARNTYPEECCGFLIGSNSRLRRVHHALLAQNEAQPSRIKRYRINPVELYDAIQEAQRTNLELIGIYHSHPDAPVEPSQVDLEYAWPEFTYIVVSLEKGEARDVGAWSLNPATNSFELEELQIV